MPEQIVKEFGKDFDSRGGALTLNVDFFLDEEGEKEYKKLPYSERNEKEFTKTNSSGWTMTGIVHEDYYFMWVNEFKAQHPTFGRVHGDFEKKVFADSQEGFDHFWENHKPEAWNYLDI